MVRWGMDRSPELDSCSSDWGSLLPSRVDGVADDEAGPPKLGTISSAESDATSSSVESEPQSPDLARGAVEGRALTHGCEVTPGVEDGPMINCPWDRDGREVIRLCR